MAREINLVPDIKNEMIKTLKLRNLILFISIVVAVASVGVTLATGLIMLGQQAALDSKKQTIDNLSNKMNSYNDLNDFLTIRDQLGNIDSLTSNKKVLSRTFNILSALIPTGADTITISELNVDLSNDAPTFTFSAQANAGQEPFIDYNVLDAFKKSMKYMRYDYGDYVDKDGNKIPAYCMIETDVNGSLLRDERKDIYAYWTIKAEGCNPSDNNSTSDDDSDTSSTSSTSMNYTTESYNGQDVVRIWRTPQFNDWYKKTEVKGQPYMDLDGNISGVPHFASACYTYTGELKSGSNTPKWVEANENCLLVPDGDEGISIYDSSNGRDDTGELVLRFSSTINFAPEVYQFDNSHMIAIAPSGRRNVTDSYVQVQAMFGERAADCAPGDTACINNTQNSSSSANNTDSNGSDNSENSGNNNDNTNNTNGGNN